MTSSEEERHGRGREMAHEMIVKYGRARSGNARTRQGRYKVDTKLPTNLDGVKKVKGRHEQRMGCGVRDGNGTHTIPSLPSSTLPSPAFSALPSPSTNPPVSYHPQSLVPFPPHPTHPPTPYHLMQSTLPSPAFSALPSPSNSPTNTLPSPAFSTLPSPFTNPPIPYHPQSLVPFPLHPTNPHKYPISSPVFSTLTSPSTNPHKYPISSPVFSALPFPSHQYPRPDHHRRPSCRHLYLPGRCCRFARLLQL
ncbi:hypothetical protein Pcinc_041441 [Petrolisthes cinctipes]|uniref:Uncharacterized protein n=1 Tax=Petrolisthes cinctipes TaxID=88211 RepID=A0AAE1BJU9_PETCI|nr:hypothetical protein Pcinc_041441 [Petrolisthes cinctipes]